MASVFILKDGIFFLVDMYSHARLEWYLSYVKGILAC